MNNILKLLGTLILVATSTLPAHAADYGVCNDAIKPNTALIDLVQPVVSVSVLSGDVLVFLVGTDSIVPVQKQYYPDMYKVLKKNHTAYIGIVEDTSLTQTPALWLHVWVATKEGCVAGGIGDRVYDARGNAPFVFWPAVAAWEKMHPDSKLKE